MNTIKRVGEFWHIPVWLINNERFVMLRDFKDIEQDMYDELAATINIRGLGISSFREFERRNGLKMFNRESKGDD